MSKQLATFVTAHERPTIKIDGVVYELLEPEDLRLKDALWLEKAAKRIDALMKQMSDESSDVTEELGDLIFKVTDILMREVPDKVKARLTDIQKLSVIQVYMTTLGKKEEGATRPLASEEGGKPLSQSSSAFMEETQNRGTSLR
jgi:hypothetical protein